MPAETHVSRSPLEPEELVEIVCRLLADVLLVEPDTVTLDADLREDLGADDLTLIDFVESLEEELGDRTVGFGIDDDDLEDLRTVRDVVDYVVARHEGLRG